MDAYYKHASGIGPWPATILHTSESKSFNIDACLPCDPSKVIVGMNETGGRNAPVASPCNFNSSAPCGLSKHFIMAENNRTYINHVYLIHLKG